MPLTSAIDQFLPAGDVTFLALLRQHVVLPLLH